MEKWHEVRIIMRKIVTVDSSGGPKLRHKSKGIMKSWIRSALSKWSGLLRSAAICWTGLGDNKHLKIKIIQVFLS